MPQVPRFNGGSSVAAFNAPQLNIRTSEESFGGFAEQGQSSIRLARNIGQAGENISSGLIEIKRQADQTLVQDALNKLKQKTNDTLRDPENGVLFTKGKNAFEAPDRLSSSFQSSLSEVEVELSNPYLKDEFRRRAADVWLDANSAVQTHVGRERRDYQNDVFKATISLAQDDAALNPNDIQKTSKSLLDINKSVDEYAIANGFSKEQADEVRGKIVGETHAKVIDSLLLKEQDLDASAYFKAVKDTIKDSDVMKYIEDKLDEGTRRGESQRFVDNLTARGVPETRAYQEAKSIKDPKLREVTEARIATVYNRLEAAKRETEDMMYRQAVSIIDQKQVVSEHEVRYAIPPAIWNSISPEKQKALVARVSDPPNNDRLWLRFNADANTSSLTLAEFEEKYWVHFDKERRGMALKMWNEATGNGGAGGSGGRGKSNFQSQYLAPDERIMTTLQQSNILKANQKPSDLKGEDATLFVRLKDEVYREANEKETRIKRKLEPLELQEVIDRKVMNYGKIESWGSDVRAFLNDVPASERANFYKPYAEIPLRERRAIENLLLSKNKTRTDDKVQKIYAAKLLGNNALVEQLLNQ